MDLELARAALPLIAILFTSLSFHLQPLTFPALIGPRLLLQVAQTASIRSASDVRRENLVSSSARQLVQLNLTEFEYSFDHVRQLADSIT